MALVAVTPYEDSGTPGMWNWILAMIAETELAAAGNVMNPIANDPNVRTIFLNPIVSHVDSHPAVRSADIEIHKIYVTRIDQNRRSGGSVGNECFTPMISAPHLAVETKRVRASGLPLCEMRIFSL